MFGTKASGSAAAGLALVHGTGLALAGVLSAPSLAGAQASQWRLDAPPLVEVGRGDGVLLHNVRDADVLADGTLLVGDNGSSSVLRVSPAGEVVESLGRPGSGPGEFELIWRVFGLGDTVVAYDSSPLHRITTWIPGAPKPEVRSLPDLNGFATELATVLSARVWLLTSFGNMPHDPDQKRAGLREVWSDVFVFDAASGASSTAGRRLMEYDYFVVEVLPSGHFGTTAYRTDFLGKAHLASAEGRWLFAPMSDAVLEVWGQTGAAPERKVQLPIDPRPHPRDVGREVRDRWLSRAGGPSAARIRGMFEDLWDGNAPEQAPAVGQVVEVGRDVWLRPFALDDESESEPVSWVVVDPVAGVVRATVEVAPDLELLGGSEDAVAVLGRTELGEQFVQVRRIARDD